jgi:hypothetical protein
VTDFIHFIRASTSIVFPYPSLFQDPPHENDESRFHYIIKRHNAVMGRLCHKAKRCSTIPTRREASEPIGDLQTRDVDRQNSARRMVRESNMQEK